MKMPYISIQWKLIVMCGLLVTGSVAGLGVLSYRVSEQEIYQSAEKSLTEQIVITREALDMTVELARQMLQTELRAARTLLDAAGIQELDQQKLTSVVTTFTEQQDGIIIIYGMTAGGAERVAGNLAVTDENQEIETVIAASSPIYQAVMQGQNSYGHIQIGDSHYQTVYAPLTDADKTLIGILCVGTIDGVDIMLDTLADIEIGKSGYIWILSAHPDTPGHYALSSKRQRDGESLYDAKDSSGRYFVQEWLEHAPTLQGSESVIDYYPWQNKGEKAARLKVAAYAYLPERHWIIGTSAYIDDFQESLGAIKRLALWVSGAAILVSTVIAFGMARFIVTPIRLGVEFASSLAAGKFTSHLRAGHHDETALLAHALNDMRDRIAAVLREITRLIQAARHGQLDVRGAAADFTGDWGTVIEGLNDLIDAFVVPIHDTGECVQRIANGDIPETIAEEYEGDFNQITQNLERLTTTLRRIVGEIRSGTAVLLTSVQELSASSQEISSTSHQQAAAIKEIVSTMEDSDQLARSIAGKITEVTEVTSTTKQMVHDGFSLLQTNRETMGDVKHTNTETITGIRVLSEKIESIWEILNMIQGVADQTRIIAFNAELEASSAGEAGKNFQIVASEIRRLADRTFDSTSEIKNKIQEIQQSADSVIMVSEEGTLKIAKGWELSNDMHHLFEDILGSADVSTQAADRIALSIRQQVSAFEQIVLTLKQVSEGVDNFVVSTAATTGATEKLRDMAGGLHTVIEEYVGENA